MAYAGHQFGGYSPRLGDGRALLLGEVVDITVRRSDMHIKGSGRTPFARGGDGKAAVGPMLREYLIGEAMHALGIPTTRALAVVHTGEYGSHARGCSRARCSPAWREPPAGRHVRVRRAARRS
jgi:serine/tyrosine/threonine adenylyltransferase